MVSKNIKVEFLKCDDGNCDPDQEKWLNDVQVDMWVIEEKIDYLIYEGRPTKHIQRRVSSNVFGEAMISKVAP